MSLFGDIFGVSTKAKRAKEAVVQETKDLTDKDKKIVASWNGTMKGNIKPNPFFREGGRKRRRTRRKRRKSRRKKRKSRKKRRKSRRKRRR